MVDGWQEAEDDAVGGGGAEEDGCMMTKRMKREGGFWGRDAFSCVVLFTMY